jgi:hypothetical protein
MLCSSFLFYVFLCRVLFDAILCALDLGWDVMRKTTCAAQ